MKKNYILIFLTTFLLMFISTAYAAFSSELIISGEGIVEKDNIAPTCGAWYLRDSNLSIQEAYNQNKFKNPATNTEWTTENQSLFIECTDNMDGDYGCINVTEITDSNNQKRYYKEVKEYTTSVKTDSNVVTVKLQDAYLNERTCSLPVGGSNPYLDKQGPTITITATDYNKFTYSATDDIGVTGYMVTTSSTKPSIDSENWRETPEEITIDNTAAKTYYVWAKDGVNITSKTIKTYKLTKTVGTGTTLTLKYKNSTGVNLTTGYVLNGTKVYVEGNLLNGYNTLELKKGTTVISTGSTQTISAATTISSSATPNIYSIVLDNQGANESGTTKVWYKYKTVTSGCYYYTDSTLSTCLTNYTITKPEKDGYTYVGYYSELNGTGTNYVNSSGTFINNIYQKLPSQINTNYTDEITLYAKWTATPYTLTYDFNTVNNMNSWSSNTRNLFNISYNSSTKMNTVSVTGSSGYWENLYIPITTVANKTYKIEFDYKNASGYTALSGYSGIGVQALTSVTNSNNLSNSIKTDYTLSPTANANIQHITFEFTATGTTTYLNFNFGMTADNKTTTVDLGNLKIVESVDYNTSVTSLPSFTTTGYTYNGWYDAVTGGNKVTSVTMPASNKTIYAQSTVNNYYLTYQGNGSTNLVNSNLVAKYDAMYHNSNTLTDISGNNKNGIATNVTFGTDYMQFDGSSWVNLGIMNSSYRSMEVTFATDVLGGCIFGNWETGGGGLFINSDGTLVSEFYISGYKRLTTTTKLEVGKKYHVATTYDGTTLKIYLNGNLESSLSVSGVIRDAQSSTVMSIGSNPVGSGIGVSAFRGKIYNASVYNAAISAEQIASDAGKEVTYDSTYGTLPTPQRAGYTFGGWYKEAALTNAVISTTKVSTASDHALYAKWTANPLTFNDQTVSSTFNASTAQTITNGITAATNGTGTYTYAITGGNDNNYFSLSGRNIIVAKNTPANTTGYNVTIKATDSNSGATKSATYTIKVNKADNPMTFTTPQSGSITYSTSAQSKAFTGAANAGGTVTYTIQSQKAGSTDVTYFTIPTNTTASITAAKNTPAGTYTIVVRASAAGNTNYNSKTLDMTYTLTVGKATPTLAVASTKALTYPSAETIDYTYDGDGTVSCEVSTANQAYVTCSVNTSTKKLTLTPIKPTTTAVTVTLKASAGTNYLAADNKTTSVTVNKATCPVPTSLAIANTGIVTWTKPSVAASSEISIDNTTFTSATSGVNYNSTITATTGSRTVYVRSVCDSTYYNSPSTSVSKATTVYSVSLTKGTGISTVTGAGNYITGSTATIDATVNKGYTWKNWTGTSTLTSTANIITVNGNKSYTANATLNTYSIGYVLNGGTATNPDSYNVTTNTFTLNNPVKTGYTFLGWTGSNGSTPSTSVSITKGSTGNKNYTANYSIIDPEAPTISGNSARVYNYAGRTLTCSTTSTYASGTNIYYEFGYASSAANWTAGTITWLGNPSTTNTYAVLKNAYIGTRYYGCRIYASDGTETTTKINTASSVDQSFVNARVYFDVATNGGTISGSENLYMPYGMTNIYTSRTSHATAGTLPVATKAGYKFDGWYTAATGGTKVIGSDRVVQASVSGWTDANKNWLRTSTSDNTTANKLYAQFTYDEEPTITRNDYNTFTVSSTAASEYFISKTQTTAPNASATGWSTTATQDVSTTAKETWYVWIKDANGNVSPNSKTITNFKVTLTIGEGTTLTATADTLDGNSITSGKYVLNGTNIYISASLNTGYSNLTITKNNVNISNPSTITVDGNITIASEADFDGVYVTFDPTGGSVDPTRKGVLTGNIYGILPTPEKQGYTFAGWSKLPEGYDELEYIESTGTQYINTNYLVTANTAIETDYQFSTVSDLQQRVFGIGGGNVFYNYYINGAGNWAYAYQNDSGNWIGTTAVANNKRHSLYFNLKGSIKIDYGSTYEASMQGTVSKTSNYPLYIMANNVSGTADHYAKTKIYSFKIYENMVIVRDYVPAINKSTGKAGLYDLVNGVFYKNSGTGDFVEGPKYGSVTSSSIVTASTNHTLRAMYNINKYNLIWDLNNVNNMNSWSFNGNYTFDISYDETSKMNSISVTGASGLWEIAYLPITTIAGKNYKIEFDYYNPNGYTPLSGYNGIGAQALTAVTNNDNSSNSLKTTTLVYKALDEVQHISLEFTATGTTTYLAFNFGMAADNLTTSVQIGNIKIIESMVYDSFIIDEPTLSPIGLTLNGFYTEKTGGSQHSLIDKMPNEDKTYYAQSTVKNYTITYNLDGGTNAASNPSTYNVNDLNLTLASPTKTGHTFNGWKTKNLFDSSGLDTSLNIVTNSDELMSSSNTTTDNRGWGYANSNLKLTLPVGTYTISFYFDSTTSNKYAQYGINYNGGSANSLAEGSLQNKWKVSRTFTVASGQTQVGIMFKIYEGKVRIQLEEGSNATPYIRSKVSGTVVFPPPSNQVFTAQWTKNNYNVTCEDYFVDRSNNLKVKLGTQSTTKSYAYGSSVSGSAWGTDTANSAYYSMYQYVGASTATVPANNNLKVYRYFTATSDINIYNPSGVQDNKSGTISISYNQGSSWYTGKTNEVQYTGFYYGDTVWVKDIAPASGYVLKNVTGATLDNGIYKLTITAASQNILIYMGNKPDGTSKTFGYTGAVQTYTAPSAGTYKLEVCGAQGGSPRVGGQTRAGGKGGCASGNVSLTAGQTLYVFVGGQGSYTSGAGTAAGGWNGGTSVTTTNGACYFGTGGGATHISKTNASIANAGSNLLIVGGGGGSGNMYYASDGTTTSLWFNGVGGNGGGASGGSGTCTDARNGRCSGTAGTGGSQTAGGSTGGTKGVGAAGGGGGGYYGGGGARGNGSIGAGNYGAGGGGGGSGYVGGVSSASWSSASCQNSGTLRTGNGCAKITKQ